MICNIRISGQIVSETVIRPISSQSEPVEAYTLVIVLTSQQVRAGIRQRCEKSHKLEQVKKYPIQSPLWDREIIVKRYIQLKTVCSYLSCKIDHCRYDESYSYGRANTYTVKVRCNLDWLISVIETEVDYHMGKKQCSKKINSRYMTEYMATQLSGFGEKFYHPEDNISNSIIAKVYKMNVPDIK